MMRYGGAWTARGLIMMCLMPRAISCQTATCVGIRATTRVAHMLGWSRSALPTKRIMIHCLRRRGKVRLYAGMKNEMTDSDLCIERLVSFSLSIVPPLPSSGGAPEASVGQCYAWRAKPPAPRARAPYTRPDFCLLYTSPSPRDGLLSRMPSSA